MRRLNVFGYNYENDPLVAEEENGDLYIDGKSFITAEISDEERAEVDELEAKVDKLSDKVSVLSVKYAVYLPAIIGVILCVLATRLPMPFSAISIVVAFFLLAVYLVWQKNVNKRTRELTRSEKAERSPALKEAIEELRKAETRLLSGVGFGDAPVRIDFIHPMYDGATEYQSYKDEEDEMIALPAFFEAVGDTLKITELFILLDIPISCLKRIERIDRRGEMVKLGDADMLPKTLPDGVSVTNDGFTVRVTFNCYYALVLEKDGEEMELTVPPYELDKLVSVTHLFVE